MAIVKSYIADTQKDAFDKVKLELGSDAVIVNTRKVRKKGLLGLFRKPAIELIAVVDEHHGHANVQKNQEEIQKILQESIKDEKLERIEKQIMQVSEAIGKVYKDVDAIKCRELAQYEPEVEPLLSLLKDQAVREENALKIAREAVEMAQSEEIDQKDALYKVLCKNIGEAAPIELTKGKTRIIFFVGPTGVGKTTTLAKIAAIFYLQFHAKVSIITEDTYRIGAVEQLRIYADILGLPLDVVYSPQEIKEKIDGMEGVDLVLVDTAGKNTMDKEYHQTIKEMIEICSADEVHLAISATTEYSVVLRILESYSFLKEYKVILTKLDECSKWGNVIDIKMLTDKSLSYITHGQNVAEDILIADSAYIANKLLEVR